jgi:hypothetical protein
MSVREALTGFPGSFCELAFRALSGNLSLRNLAPPKPDLWLSARFVAPGSTGYNTRLQAR